MSVYSQYSDWSYTTATAIYVLAMLFFLVEQAFGRVALRRAEQQEVKQRALVGAGAAVTVTPAEPP
ncbi:MAG: c-type cytochrome biogenesis protein CcsB, partial [Thermocrispum sp.]